MCAPWVPAVAEVAAPAWSFCTLFLLPSQLGCGGSGFSVLRFVVDPRSVLHLRPASVARGEGSGCGGSVFVADGLGGSLWWSCIGRRGGGGCRRWRWLGVRAGGSGRRCGGWMLGGGWELMRWSCSFSGFRFRCGVPDGLCDLLHMSGCFFSLPGGGTASSPAARRLGCG